MLRADVSRYEMSPCSPAAASVGRTRGSRPRASEKSAGAARDADASTPSEAGGAIGLDWRSRSERVTFRFRDGLVSNRINTELASQAAGYDAASGCVWWTWRPSGLVPHVARGFARRPVVPTLLAARYSPFATRYPVQAPRCGLTSATCRTVSRRCRLCRLATRYSLLAVLCGCATGGRPFPTHPTEAPAAIQRASALIQDAVVAGADSLAPEPLTAARQHLAEAQAERQGKHPDRAPESAHLAAADATYAKALAQCLTAEHTLRAEQAALAALPPVPGAPPSAPPPAVPPPASNPR